MWKEQKRKERTLNAPTKLQRQVGSYLIEHDLVINK